MDFLAVLNEIDNFIWGPPLLVLLVGTGIPVSYTHLRAHET